MTQTNITTAGIDTSKLKLDIAVHGRTERWQVANALPGWRALAADLAKAGVTRVGIEATGGYERGVVQHLRAMGFVVLVLQPIQVKAYARMHLRRAKNDALDAVLIAACAAALDQPRITPDPRLTELAGLLTFVEQIEEDIARYGLLRTSAFGAPYGRGPRHLESPNGLTKKPRRPLTGVEFRRATRDPPTASAARPSASPDRPAARSR